MPKSEQRCPRCGGLMVRGSLRTRGAHDDRVRVVFVVPGVKTSWNPVEAFRQGLSDELEDKTFDLSEMGGYLCQTCGHIDLYAWTSDEPSDL